MNVDVIKLPPGRKVKTPDGEGVVTMSRTCKGKILTTVKLTSGIEIEYETGELDNGKEE